DTVDAVFRDVKREVKKNWLSLVDEGLNPTFVHRVPSTRAGSPVRITGENPRISGTKESVYDWGSSVNDVMVALDHAAMELLAKRGHARFMGEMADLFGRDY